MNKFAEMLLAKPITQQDMDRMRERRCAELKEKCGFLRHQLNVCNHPRRSTDACPSPKCPKVNETPAPEHR